MNDKIKRFAFYNIFFLCTFIDLFMVLSFSSYASERFNITTLGVNYENVSKSEDAITFINNDNTRLFAILNKNSGNSTNPYMYELYSNKIDTLSFTQTTYVLDWNTGETINTSTNSLSMQFQPYNNIYRGYNFVYKFSASSNLYIFDNLQDLQVYLSTGTVPDIPFDETLKLDSFKVTSWQVGTFQATFKSKFEVTWSDERISNVQVRIVGTANSPASFESNSSPFKQKFAAQNYVMKNGDVIHFTATPFKSNGEYGESLYYSLVYDDNLPSNWYRKLVNTPYNDTTITIPYTNVSGQPQSVTLPVDGVTTNKVYKVNYNPVTYEYGDLNLYEIYYSPVVVYPGQTPEEEIDETQDVVTNVYTTNNYNTINNNTNYDFNINFGDISENDIQDSYDDVGNFINGFGSFIGKIVNFFGILFPFFPIGVSIAIITAFGIVALLLIVALVIKIVSAIKNFIF